MPITIDQNLFPSLYTITSTPSYPAPLKAVLGLRQTDPFLLMSVVSQVRFAPPLRTSILDVTWFGFRSPYPNRLPNFYACELTMALAAGAPIKLYELGAIGNRFEVDILLTNAGGQNAIGLSENGTPVQVADLTALGFYEAKRAFWSPPPASGGMGRCKNEVTLTLSNAFQRCILWVVSYKHLKYGNRPGTLAYAALPPAPFGSSLHQDDDGSPGDPDPGGDGE